MKRGGGGGASRGGGGGGGRQTDAVERLMALGVGRAKAVQALKDSGNNVETAIRVVTWQQKQQQQQQRQPPASAHHGDAAVPPTASSASASIPSLHRSKPPATSSTFASAPSSASFLTNILRRESRRRHPCVVQFGSCQFGEHCAFKDLPGDVCVQHCQRRCLYGEQCHRRHHIDGVDVREYLSGSSKNRDGDAADAAVAAAALLRSGDVTYRVNGSTGLGSKVLTAQRVMNAEDGGDTYYSNGVDTYSSGGGRGAAAALLPPSPPLLASNFNRIRGSVPSYTDPLQQPQQPQQQQQHQQLRRCSSDDDDDGNNDGSDVMDDDDVPEVLEDEESAAGADVAEDAASGDDDAVAESAHRDSPWVVQAPAAATAHPTPFRDLVRNHAGVPPPPPSTAAPPPPPPPPVDTSRPHRERHPCVAQYGSCRFGDACSHADRDADVCVHFLNNRCRYTADTCRYRHETQAEYEAAQRRRREPPPMQGTPPPPPAPASAPAPQPVRVKQRLQGGVVTRPATSGRGGEDAPLRSRAALSAVPSAEDVASVSASRWLDSRSATEDTRELQYSPFPPDDADADAGGDVHDGGATEMHVFLGLLEVFPAVEPAVVLQALRVSAGDVLLATDVITRVGGDAADAATVADVDDVAAALAVAAAEDADDAAAAVQQDSHAAVLTLLSLFPTVEPVAVEAVLSQHRGDFADAYSALLCTQESVARSALWRGSTAALSPADQLRVEKLRALFPDLDADVVRSAFCAADREWSRATMALNELTMTLLSLDSGVVPAKASAAAEWRPGSTAGDDSASSPASRAAAAAAAAASAAASPRVESSSEAYAAYRAAESEILELGDWRRVRQQAYLMNTQRLRVLGQATAAFLGGDGRTAHTLSREGRRLGIEYNRLNRLAMLALEQERLRTDATSTLDLHGFHTAEVHDVLLRRVRVCQQRRIGMLRIVTGEGKHSRRGQQSLYPTVMELLRAEPYLAAVTKVKSVKPGYVDVAVRRPASAV